MKKLFMDCNAYRLRKSPSVTEGGMSRYMAMRNYLINNLNYKPISISGNRTISAIQVIVFFLLHRNTRIFIMYPTNFFVMGSNSRVNRFLGDLAVKTFQIASKHNMMVVDVADLKYEQFIDLEIPCDNLELVRRREKKLFDSSAGFIFASASMRDYAVRKYYLALSRCDVCNNGGREQSSNPAVDISEIANHMSSKTINCVYAGTMNKGRMIDKMIDSFKETPSARLYLMGPMGEWVEEYLANNEIYNVYYLGEKDEETAHRIVCICDLGLIPYDENRLYYNIAYPTKLSFYLTAGIPYLATPVKEVEMLHNENIGITGIISEWSTIINNLTEDQIFNMKREIETKQEQYTWDYLLKRCRMINE